MGLGFAFSSAPDVGKAKTATKHILHLIDSEPTLDYTNCSGIKLAVSIVECNAISVALSADIDTKEYTISLMFLLF